MLYALHSRLRLLKWFVVLLLYSVQAIDVQLCTEQESVDITNGTMDGDGSVEYLGVRYNSSQYFQDGNIRKGCICLIRQCIYVCEAPEFVNVGLKELYANVSDAMGENNRKINLAADNRFHLILAEPYCEKLWFTLEQDHVIVTYKGDLNQNGYILNYSQFCMLPKNNMGMFHASYCEHEIRDLPYPIYAFGFLVSLPFLVATFVVYAILPELQNVSGKSLMSYVACLAISYLLVALGRLDVYEYILCVVSAYILYFMLMASFFWLNVMSFDIYRTIGGSRGRMTERRKFVYYSLYAWGSPLLFLSLILLFDHTELISYQLRPNVGAEGCFLKDERLTQFLYLYLPLLIIISANILFFTITAKRINQSDRTGAITINDNSGQHSRREHDHNTFRLYLRLFFVMVLSWSMEIISSLMTEAKTAPPQWVVYLLDFWSCLVGIIIFILLVCNERVKNLLLKRYV
uniref:G-protein coupled receptors family 2 profile 2 domain-containing protein n=1 Tax=Anopheles albimanus TaxID=7167 RepID=A0A182FDQ8_ANOAL